MVTKKITRTITTYQTENANGIKNHFRMEEALKAVAEGEQYKGTAIMRQEMTIDDWNKSATLVPVITKED